MKKLVIGMLLINSIVRLAVASEHCGSGCSYKYKWNQNLPGFAACYQFNQHGDILNGGFPVSEENCEQRLVHYFWNEAINGTTRCYKKVLVEVNGTNTYLFVNDKFPVSDQYCCDQ